MTEQIHVVIPEGLTDEEIKEYLIEHQADYDAAFDYSAVYGDERSQVDGLSVECVEINGRDVEVQYDVELSAHHACSDHSYVKVQDRYLRGKRVGNVVIFDVDVPQPPRSTFEEF